MRFSQLSTACFIPEETRRSRSESGAAPTCMSSWIRDISVAKSGFVFSVSIWGSMAIAAEDRNGQKGPTGVNAMLREDLAAVKICGR